MTRAWVLGLIGCQLAWAMPTMQHLHATVRQTLCTPQGVCQQRQGRLCLRLPGYLLWRSAQETLWVTPTDVAWWDHELEQVRLAKPNQLPEPWHSLLSGKITQAWQQHREGDRDIYHLVAGKDSPMAQAWLIEQGGRLTAIRILNRSGHTVRFDISAHSDQPCPLTMWQMHWPKTVDVLPSQGYDHE